MAITSGASSFTVEDIFRSSIRDFGAFYLFQKLSEQMGLSRALPCRRRNGLIFYLPLQHLSFGRGAAGLENLLVIHQRGVSSKAAITEYQFLIRALSANYYSVLML